MTGCTILACHASAAIISNVASNVATLLSWYRHHIGVIVTGTLYKRKLKAWGEAFYTSELTVQTTRKVGNQGSQWEKRTNLRKRSELEADVSIPEGRLSTGPEVRP